MRTKEVFSDYSDIAHRWAHSQQDRARTSNGNFYFERDVIYSYGSHFPIARLDKKEDKTTVFFTLRSYSVSTAGHINLTRSAIPYNFDVLYMAHVITGDYDNTEGFEGANHRKNIDYWERELGEAFEKLAKARKKEIYINKIADITAQLQAYIKYFDLPTDESIQALIKDANPDTFTAYLKQENTRIQEAKKRKEKADKQKLSKELREWRQGKKTRIYTRLDRDYLRINEYDQTIDTSQNISIPIEDAKRFYKMIKAILNQGGCKGNCTAKLMHQYDLQEANNEFIIVGCHKVYTKEYEAIATKLKF